MSSISSLTQAKLSGRIVHSVKQRVARRAEYPNAVKRRVRLGAPGTVPTMLWLVGDIKNPRLSARLAFARRFRMASIEPLQISIRPKLLPRLCIVFARLLRLLVIEIRARFPRAFYCAFVRAMPLVAFSPSIGKEMHTALSAMPTFAQQLSRLSVVSEFLLARERTELLPSGRRFKSSAALAAMFGAFHV
jgi:hypothetical protein